MLEFVQELKAVWLILPDSVQFVLGIVAFLLAIKFIDWLTD